MKTIDGMISNKRAKEIVAQEDLGDGCGNCRFYQEDAESGEAVCLKHEIKTVCIALCRQWEKRN